MTCGLLLSAALLGTTVPAAAAPPTPSGPPATRPELPAVAPVTQTRPFGDAESADPPNSDADDPAIWVHPNQPHQSVVVGTLKEGGLVAFDLAGRELQHLAAPPPPTPEAAPGRFNNIDVLGSLAIVSDRGRDRIRVYAIDPRGAAAGSQVLRDLTSPATPRVFSASEAGVDEQRTAYGLAAGTDRDTGRPFVVASRRSETELARLALVRDASGVAVRRMATLRLPDTFTLPDGTRWQPCTDPGDGPQVEGMVVDSERGVLYAAQEAVGIWRIPLTHEGFGTPALIDRVRGYGVPASYDEASDECVVSGPDPGFGGRWLTADAEGLTTAKPGHLIASSQGDSTFVVYERGGRNRHVGGFRVGAGGGNDSVEHSDGAAVVTTPLGKDYPAGLLVVHDGERRPALRDPEGEEIDTTGFAYVSWKAVAAYL